MLTLTWIAPLGTVQGGIFQVRTGHIGTGQVLIDKVRTGQHRTVQVRTGLGYVKSEEVKSG